MKTTTDGAGLDRVFGNADAWLTIDELVDLCDAEQAWPEGFFDTAVRQAKKAFLRRMIKQRRGEDGFPEWASVEMTDAEGTTRRTSTGRQAVVLRAKRRV